jgi:hypothetical protein
MESDSVELVYYLEFLTEMERNNERFSYFMVRLK